MLEVLVVQGCISLVPVKAKTVSGPEIARQSHYSPDATQQANQSQEGDQGPHAPKPKGRRQPGGGNHDPGYARELQR